jgi:hypothetical protein
MMMMKSLVVKFLCFVILLSSFVACETDQSKPPTGQQQKHQQNPHSKAKEIDNDDDDGKLPNLWDDEIVNRMVREILARDLAKENSQNLIKTRYRRDISTTTTTSEGARKVPSTTRKTSATPKSSRKPVRQTQTNKNKNRVTQSSTIAATTSRATVKPSTKPTSIVTSTTFGTNSLKAKVRILILV